MTEKNEHRERDNNGRAGGRGGTNLCRSPDNSDASRSALGERGPKCGHELPSSTHCDNAMLLNTVSTIDNWLVAPVRPYGY